MKTFKEFCFEHIIKTDGGYKLVSKKTGKNLGTSTSKSGILKREREVQYFKHMKEDGVAVSSGPTNVVGSGAIAGTGGKGGEPGVHMPRRKKSPVMLTIARRKRAQD